MEEVCVKLSSIGKTPHWSRGRTLLPEQQQKQCDEVITTPILCLPEMKEGEEGPGKD